MNNAIFYNLKKLTDYHFINQDWTDIDIVEMLYNLSNGKNTILLALSFAGRNAGAYEGHPSWFCAIKTILRDEEMGACLKFYYPFIYEQYNKMIEEVNDTVIDLLFLSDEYDELDYTESNLLEYFRDEVNRDYQLTNKDKQLLCYVSDDTFQDILLKKSLQNYDYNEFID